MRKVFAYPTCFWTEYSRERIRTVCWSPRECIGHYVTRYTFPIACSVTHVSLCVLTRSQMSHPQERIPLINHGKLQQRCASFLFFRTMPFFRYYNKKPISIFKNSNLVSRLGGVKQNKNKSHRSWGINELCSGFICPSQAAKFEFIVYRNCPFQVRIQRRE